MNVRTLSSATPEVRGAPSAPGRDASLPEMIAAQAARTPDAVAVETSGAPRAALSYAELMARADELAGRLRVLGVAAGDRVGVCLRRGPDLVAALLAVWRTGAAYVPMDPDHPAERLAWVLADTRVRVVVSGRAERVSLPAPGDTVVLDVEGHGAPGAVPPALAAAADVPDGPALPRNHAEAAQWPAYVLHTSGSTGRPKGVVVGHAAIANRVRWLAERHGLGAGDRVLQKTTIGFDAAGLELFGPLVAGATVVLAPAGAERDPAAMLAAVAASRITVLQAVPSVLRALVDLPGWEGCTALRLVFSAGEPLHAELCHRLLARVPQVEIWNTYGPTECAVDITEQRFDPARRNGPVPIGLPLGGLRVLILDGAGEPVTPGGEGELYAGGTGVALGYLGRPALTAERFVPDPWGPPGSRLYRTGDRVRLSPEGVLEYLGRLDNQLKVNGVRVEPGEVEAALVAHPQVAAAVVGAVPDRSGGQRITAWIKAHGTVPAPAELRAFLRRTLPDPLIPAGYVPVPAFALTPSGKTDRAALPAPEPGGQAAGEPPRTAAERFVAHIWADLLGLPRDAVGAHDDFFQSGGSSLQLFQLAERLGDRSGHRLDPRALFTASTVALQAALLGAALEGEGTGPSPGGAVGHAVVPVAREGALPLAYGQRGLWLLEQIRPGSPEWTTPQWVRLPAEWTEETVRTALGLLQERHEVLRTRYELRDDGPVQVVERPGPPVELRIAEADGAAVQDLVAGELGRGFDLANGPVWRALLIRGASHGQLLLLSAHHLACDGWSSVLLERDLRALGASVLSGEDPVLPELRAQYADHAAWQSRRLTPEAMSRDLDYWRTQLSGVTPLELPADRPRAVERDGRGGLRTHTVPAELVERVAALGRDAGATLHQTLLTAFSVLVARLSGRTDFTIGMPVAGRQRPEVAQTVGFFLNNLVLRCRLDTDRSFLESLASVRDTVLDAFTHQELPFDRLVQELEPERDLSRTPLYQVMFDFHEEGRTGTALTPDDLALFSGGWQSARTDLTLVVQRQPDGRLLVRAEYATALFDAATVDELIACWVQTLESFAADPTMSLARAEILPAAEHDRLVALGRGDGRMPAQAEEDCLFAEFERAARRTPDSVAVVCGDERWTYARLAERAAAFAAALRERGAGPEDTVAVLLPRTPDLIASLLGVWQAGATHVPLDRAVPDERIGHILADAAVRFVVTDPAGAARLAPVHRGAFLTADDLGPAGEVSVTPADRDPARLAYLIYTSGTTGRPKGVAVEHRAIRRVLHAGREHLGFGQGPDDAWLALAVPTFDIAFTELVMPLLAGGRVVLARDEETTDYPALIDLIDRHGVTHLQCAFPQWRMLVEAGLGKRPLVGQTGGQPCPPALARELAGLLDTFVNEYGLTETAIAVTRWTADTAAPAVLLGRPYAHATARVLDPLLRPVPRGAIGELCVGGTGLFRGYAGRPAQTAERLVPDPYGPPGARLFRTGDLARMLPDGSLVFAGRADGQVKIRGRRVETGEVQAVLGEHPAVGEAVVVTHGSGDDARLVAYCVPAPGHRLPRQGVLVDHCARRLPDYMLPTVVVALDTMPLTRHNKVDLTALPVPDLRAVADTDPYVAPEGELEETIAGIWRDVLAGPDGAAPRVGAHSGFFRLGGDSIRAARVVAGIQMAYDVTVPLRTFFDRPTVAALARAVEAAVRAEIASLSDAELAAAHREYLP